MAKTTDNDKKIRELKDAIQKQIEEMPKIEKDFKTNLSLTFYGTYYNLNVVTENELMELLIRLYNYNQAIDALKLAGFTLCNYSVPDWMDDIQLLIKIKHNNTRLAELRKNYNKIDSMLSDTAKTEDFLNDLEKFLTSH